VVKKWKLWPLVTRWPFDLYRKVKLGISVEERKKELIYTYGHYTFTIPPCKPMLQGELRSRRLYSAARPPAVLTTSWYISCHSEPALVLFSTPCQRLFARLFIKLISPCVRVRSIQSCYHILTRSDVMQLHMQRCAPLCSTAALTVRLKPAKTKAEERLGLCDCE